MRTLYIAATCVLLAAPAAHAGSLVDSFLGGGGGGFSIGDCNTDHCNFSVGKQKLVVRRNPTFGAAATGHGDRREDGGRRSPRRGSAPGALDTSASERTAPSRQQPVVDRSDDRPTSRRDDTVACAGRTHGHPGRYGGRPGERRPSRAACHQMDVVAPVEPKVAVARAGRRRTRGVLRPQQPDRRMDHRRWRGPGADHRLRAGPVRRRLLCGPQ